MPMTPDQLAKGHAWGNDHKIRCSCGSVKFDMHTDLVYAPDVHQADPRGETGVEMALFVCRNCAQIAPFMASDIGLH